MTHQKRRWLIYAVATTLILIMILAACGDRPTPQVVFHNAATTQAYENILATTNAPPTAGPSPTPTPTSTPYLTATPFPDADPEMVVARVGSEEITLAEFQARVRYERWLPLFALGRSIEDRGPERILDLTLPENTNTLQLFYTLSDAESMGSQAMNAYLTEQIVLREATRRDLDLEQTFFDGRVAARIGVELGTGGARPGNWDEAYQEFLDELYLYTGMEEDQFIEIMQGITYYETLRAIISDQAPIETEGITAATVEDIILDSREDAVDVRQRLIDGEPMSIVAASYGKSTSTGETERVVRRDDEGLTTDLLDAIYNGDAGDVLGPFPTEAGWYVVHIIGFELDILRPTDVDAIRREYYRQWIIERLDDPEYTTDFDNWRDFVPADPLPQDVSPYMRDEFFTLPDDPFADFLDATATPEPLGVSPR